jgi:hypothetical protein
LAQVVETEVLGEYILFLVEVYHLDFQNGDWGWEYTAEMMGIKSKHFN